MSNHQTTNLTISAARKILQSYSCLQVKVPQSVAEKQQLKEALLLIVSLSESENLGICADNSIQGLRALSCYLSALDYQHDLDSSSVTNISEPVYIKFNTQKMSYFTDTYSGDYRGVLVACQSEDDQVNGTYGYFPLDLFD